MINKKDNTNNTQNTTPKPDYEYWSKMDIWKFKEAAMLFQEIEPIHYSKIKFNVSALHLPPELHKAYRTYLIFQTMQWKHLFAYHQPHLDAHPFDIFLHARKKELKIPDELSEFMIERIQREAAEHPGIEKYRMLLETFSIPKKRENNENSDDEETQAFSARERRNLLKTLGVLILLFIEKNKNAADYKRANKPNAYQIAQTIIDKAGAIELEIEGLKSIDRKITEACLLIEQETNLFLDNH
jgi:hypothetical protein